MRTISPGHGVAGVAPSTGWTFQRGLIAIGCVVSILSPILVEGLKTYTDPFILVVLLPSLLGLAFIAWKARPWTYLTSGILASLFPLVVLLMFQG